ncbi:ABC transporter substrate-binding protein [Pelagovum pacificum]|uniref:Peptide ABC transporter substrate-binding protein n=1 Tax=Pelagovum pacificum TaxID=2588711 RepID=A0A5C5GGY5_9RHOB|nr:ABC transporter substrate-binding protein [Pelagovum pacificum]QQA42903.1 peptide ABC transporter substrate-binding protein [Pelagovum pacificum]TNY33953.1 peptide ABC transporter substrate-binding protein [Pelagovum pacificum]
MSGSANRRHLLAAGLAAAVFAASGMPVRAGGVRGGTLRAGLGGGSATDSWDGATHDGLFMTAVAAGAVFDTLTEVAADGALRGELATGWEPSSDARTWDFTLRDGVRFHDGAPFSAADVVATFDRLGSAGPLAQVTSIEATGPLGLRLTLAAPNANLPFELSDPRLFVQPRGEVTPVGTGLYRVGAFEPGRRFLGRRVDEHWKDGRAGWFEQVDVLAIDPSAVRLAALRSGRVDAIDGVDLHAVGMLRASGDHVVSEAGDWVQAVSHRVGMPGRIGTKRPMDDARFIERWWAA